MRGLCCAQLSGSTATVLAVSGWQAIIASVGDSCAYLDTGAEVVLVSTYTLVPPSHEVQLSLQAISVDGLLATPIRC